MKVLRDKSILLISPEPWGKVFLSKHYYALELARAGNNVIFLEPQWPHLAARRMEEAAPRLFVLTDHFHPRGLRYLPSPFQRLMLRQAARTLGKVSGLNFDLVWSFDNSRWFHLDTPGAAWRIHHVVDLEMNFRLPEAARSAQLCLGVSQPIVQMLRPHNLNTHFVPHGYSPPSALPSLDIPGRQSAPKALYCGNLHMQFFDLEFSAQLAEKFPQIDFVMVGSTGRDNLNTAFSSERQSIIERMQQMPNVFLTGQLSNAEAQSLMHQADMLLLLYFNYPRQVNNSSKLLQYLAAGKVIVANATSEYEGTGLLETASTREEYLALFQQVAERLDKYNSLEEMDRRKQFAARHTYAAHLQYIDQLLSEIP